jgi:histidinol phosphatase-like PHP family hydrolase
MPHMTEPDSPFRTHDYHFHSTCSECCHDERLIPWTALEHAVRSGYDSLCLTDHLWDGDVPGASGWYAPQNIEHVRSVLPLPQQEGVRFFHGCETEYCGGAKLGLSRAHCDLFAFIVIPTTHMHMKGFVRPENVTTETQMTELYVERLEQLLRLELPWNKIGIAHLSCALLFQEGDIGWILRHLDEKRMMRVFDAVAERGTGIELNAGCMKQWREDPDTWLRVFRMAKKAGCLFYSSSDAHSVERLDSVPEILPGVADALGLGSGDRYHIPA